MQRGKNIEKIDKVSAKIKWCSFCLTVYKEDSNDCRTFTGWPKNGTFLYALTSSNINRFSKLFHCQNQDTIFNNTILKIQPHLKCVATLPCEMSSVLKATIENETTSVTTHYTC